MGWSTSEGKMEKTRSSNPSWDRQWDTENVFYISVPYFPGLSGILQEKSSSTHQYKYASKGVKHPEIHANAFKKTRISNDQKKGPSLSLGVKKQMDANSLYIGRGPPGALGERGPKKHSQVYNICHTENTARIFPSPLLPLHRWTST